MKTIALKSTIAIYFTLAIVSTCHANDFSLTSYYPAPYGTYGVLRLTPTTPTGTCGIGSISVNQSSTSDISVCQDGGSGTTAWGPLPGYWKQVSNNLYPSDTITSPNLVIGIGTENPEFKLSIKGDGGILTKGTYNSGVTLSTNGSGTRLMWYPKKSAYRAGVVTDTQWDDANIGAYSVVSGGINNMATNENTVVVGGDTNLAKGKYSTVAGGSNNQALGDTSAVGGGLGNIASGTAAVIGGGDNGIASGAYSAICGGKGVNANGDYSAICGGRSVFATGKYSTICGGSIGLPPILGPSIPHRASGDYSAIAGGYGNQAMGVSSFIGGGIYNTALGLQSTICGGGAGVGAIPYNDTTGGNKAFEKGTAIAGGRKNTANAPYASIIGGDSNTVLGYAATIPGGASNIANGDFSMAMGRNMQLSAAAERTFVWGHSNAPVSITTPDVFIIYSGNVGIGTVAPAQKLHVNGNVKVTGTLYLSNPPASVPALSPALYRNNNVVSPNYQKIGLDMAEQFETTEEVEVGDVLVIDQSSQIKIKKSDKSNAHGIVGIASGSPGIIFNENKLQMSPPAESFTKGKKVPVALAGRVPCKVSNEGGPIHVGDLLTTSSIPGYAMKANIKNKTRGTIVGKALEAFSMDSQHEKTGIITVFVTLQ